MRELREETGLEGRIIRFLLEIPYKYGMSTTFLVEAAPLSAMSPGRDPEERHAGHRKLVGVEWLPLADLRGNPEIEALLRIL